MNMAPSSVCPLSQMSSTLWYANMVNAIWHRATYAIFFGKSFQCQPLMCDSFACRTKKIFGYVNLRKIFIKINFQQIVRLRSTKPFEWCIKCRASHSKLNGRTRISGHFSLRNCDFSLGSECTYLVDVRHEFFFPPSSVWCFVFGCPILYFDDRKDQYEVICTRTALATYTTYNANLFCTCSSVRMCVETGTTDDHHYMHKSMYTFIFGSVVKWR